MEKMGRGGREREREREREKEKDYPIYGFSHPPITLLHAYPRAESRWRIFGGETSEVEICVQVCSTALRNRIQRGHILLFIHLKLKTY